MDVNLIRGALLVGLIIGFAGMWIWAWSKKRKPDFDRAARMPLEEDEGSGSINHEEGKSDSAER